jgi:SMC interacting uncharacterized protein involved in chromosome segregation
MEVMEIVKNAVEREQNRNLPLNMGLLETVIQQVMEDYRGAIAQVSTQFELAQNELKLELEEAKSRVEALKSEVDYLRERLSKRERTIKDTMIRVRDKQENSKIMDDIDIKKVNLFCPVIEEFGEDLPGMETVCKKVKGLRNALYASRVENRLWMNWAEFKQDLHDWLHNEGHWTLSTANKTSSLTIIDKTGMTYPEGGQAKE